MATATAPALACRLSGEDANDQVYTTGGGAAQGAQTEAAGLLQ